MKSWNKSRGIVFLCIVTIIFSMFTFGFSQAVEITQSSEENQIIEAKEALDNSEETDEKLINTDNIKTEEIESQDLLNVEEESEDKSMINDSSNNEIITNEASEEQDIIFSDDLDEKTLETELLEKQTLEDNLDLLTIDELDEYLTNLSGKELSKVLKKIDKSKAKNFLKKVLKYSDDQINGEAYIVNKNGNLFQMDDYKLKPHLPTLSNRKSSEMSWKKYLSNGKKEIIPINSDNKSNIESTDKDKLDDTYAVYERVEKRDEYTKNYAMSDGTTLLEIANTPTHYFDSGEYKEIDLEIKKTNKGKFENGIEDNTYKSYFNDYNSLDEQVLVRYEKINENGEKRFIEFIVPDAKPTGQLINQNVFKYYNIYPDVDIEYYIGTDNLKENIYINKPRKSYDFKTILRYEDMEIKQAKDGSLELIDNDTNEVLWNFNKPYAEDSGLDQKITYDLKYSVNNAKYKGEKVKELTLKFNDKKFIKEAVYPIIIDPTLFPNENNYGSINSRSRSSYYDYQRQYLIFGSPNGADDTYVDFLNFDLSAINSNAYIDLCELQIYPAGDLGSNKNSPYTAKRLEEGYYMTSWNNPPDYTSENAVTWTSYPTDTKFFRITDLMNDAWQSNFHGIRINGEPNDQTGFYTLKDDPSMLIISYFEMTPVNIDRVINADENDKYVNKTSTAFQIFINCHNELSDSLETKMYIKPEGEAEYLSSEGIIKGNIAPVFTVDFQNMNDGKFTLRFETTDGRSSDSKSYDFYLDNNGPVFEQVNISPLESSIDLSVTGYDEGYPSEVVQYEYSLDGVSSPYETSTNKTYTNLTPGTSYDLSITAKDSSDLTTTYDAVVNTLAKKPVLTKSNVTHSSFDLEFMEGNGVNSEYQVKVNDLYVMQDGTLSDTPTWLTITDHLITVNGLESGTDYQVQSKARNADLIETAYSDMLTITTSTQLPDTIENISFSLEGNDLLISWDLINNVTGYELLINGEMYSSEMNSYTLSDIVPTSKYTVQVRGVNAGGFGQWSLEESITPANAVDINTTNGSAHFISINVSNETSFEGKIYRVIYDALALELIDSCAYTLEKELEIKTIQSEGIEILSISPGTVEFSFLKNINSGDFLTGSMNVLKFRGLQNTTTNVKMEIE